MSPTKYHKGISIIVPLKELNEKSCLDLYNLCKSVYQLFHAQISYPCVVIVVCHNLPDNPFFESKLPDHYEGLIQFFNIDKPGIYQAIDHGISNVSLSHFMIMGQDDLLIARPDDHCFKYDISVLGSRFFFEGMIRFKYWEICQQNCIYKTKFCKSVLGFSKFNLPASSDHLFHLNLLKFNPSLPTKPMLKVVRYKGLGFSYFKYDPAYHLSLPSLRFKFQGFISGITALLFRQVKRSYLSLKSSNPLRVDNILRKRSIHVIIITNRTLNFTNTISSLLLSFSANNFSKYTVTCLIDDRYISENRNNFFDTLNYMSRYENIHVILLSNVLAFQSGLKDIDINRGSLRNLCLSLAKKQFSIDNSDFLLFLDGDVVLNKSHVKRLISSPHPWISLPMLYLPKRSNLRFVYNVRFLLEYIKYVRRCAVRELAFLLRVIAPSIFECLYPYSPTTSSAIFLINSQLFNVVGGFKELQGWGAEDTLLGFDLYKFGSFPILPNLFFINPPLHQFHAPASKKQKQQIRLFLKKQYRTENK